MARINDSKWLKIDGESQECECGCKLFHEVDRRENGEVVFECNACPRRYVGEYKSHNGGLNDE